MMGTQKPTHTREARVVHGSVEQQLRTVLFGVTSHAAEFVYIEWLAVQSYALLAVNGRLSVFQQYGNEAYDEERRKDNNTHTSYQEIKKSLHLAFLSSLKVLQR